MYARTFISVAILRLRYIVGYRFGDGQIEGAVADLHQKRMFTLFQVDGNDVVRDYVASEERTIVVYEIAVHPHFDVRA